MAISIVATSGLSKKKHLRAVTAAVAATGGGELCTLVKMAVGNRDVLICKETDSYLYVVIIIIISSNQYC